ncbi:MAG TPA: hypothetical protein VNN77_03015 [candidate division Zixibacteria bacterium]|nr:hypothetical protein [candidate division Zixibacteria bacterium]
MRPSRDSLWRALSIFVLVLLARASAFAACNPALGTKCGDFGKNTITLISTASGPCPVDVPLCTRYTYQYNGTNTNQIEVLIPKTVQSTFVTTAPAAGCAALITDSSGEPANNFGTNILTHNLCKLPANIANGTTFDIFADPSAPKPLSWQVIVNRSITADALNGPAVPAAGVEETGATLTTSEGVSVSYTISSGQIEITDFTGTTPRLLPITQTKLCLPSRPGDPVTFTNAQGGWTCETITFATEQCDIKTAGSDPCRFVGGSCVQY